MSEYRTNITVTVAAPKDLEAWEALLSALEADWRDYGPVLSAWTGHSTAATITLASEADNEGCAVAECSAVVEATLDSLRWPWQSLALEDVEEVVEEIV